MAAPLTIEVECDDAWKSVADLNGTPQLPVVFTEAFLTSLEQALYFVVSPFTPLSTALGIPVSVGQTAGVGPVASIASGWSPSQIWVRNQDAGNTAKIVLTGNAEGA